jgi:uncharacterized protein YbaP (TraB family)
MRALLSALLAAAWLLAACAQPPPSPALWRIADADSEIWLFGSVHVLGPDVRWRSARVDAALAAADEFVTETDTGPEAAARYQELASRYGSLPEGETLSARLDEADAARLRRIAPELGFDPAAMEHVRPWLAALQLSYAALAREGQSSEAGVETVLGAEARAQGKRISYLETPEQQVRVLAELSPDDEARFLSLTLREIEAGTETAHAMDRAWVRGDVASLQRQLDAQWREAGPAFRTALIVNRNRAWADEIEQRLHGAGRIFIAVGAAHLIGDDSVVALLRARGIVVEGP